jgi:hypothetical protein
VDPQVSHQREMSIRIRISRFVLRNYYFVRLKNFTENSIKLPFGPDPDSRIRIHPQRSEKLDPDPHPHQIKIRIRIRIKVMWIRNTGGEGDRGIQ